MKVPKPRINKKLITVEDNANPIPERGWMIASGKTNRIVEAHANPPPPDAVTALVASVGKRLPCTFRRKPNGNIDTFTEGSYAL